MWTRHQIAAVVLLSFWGPTGFTHAPLLLYHSGGSYSTANGGQDIIRTTDGMYFGLPCVVLYLALFTPLLLLQLKLGALWQQHILQTFSTKLPIATGLGVACLVRGALLVVVSVPRLAVCVYYLSLVLGARLPYWGCGHAWNSPQCCDLPVLAFNDSVRCYNDTSGSVMELQPQAIRFRTPRDFYLPGDLDMAFNVTAVTPSTDYHWFHVLGSDLSGTGGNSEGSAGMVGHLVWATLVSWILLLLMIVGGSAGFGWVCLMLAAVLSVACMMLLGFVYTTMPGTWAIMGTLYHPAPHALTLTSSKMWRNAFLYLSRRLGMFVGTLPSLGKCHGSHHTLFPAWISFLVALVVLPNLSTLLYSPMMEDLAAQKAMGKGDLNIDYLHWELESGGILSLTYSGFWIFVHYSIMFILISAFIAWQCVILCECIVSGSVAPCTSLKKQAKYSIVAAVLCVAGFAISLLFCTPNSTAWQEFALGVVEHLDWVLFFLLSLALLIVCCTHKTGLSTMWMSFLFGWSAIALKAVLIYSCYLFVTEIVPGTMGGVGWGIAAAPLASGIFISAILLPVKLRGDSKACQRLFCGSLEVEDERHTHLGYMETTQMEDTGMV